MKTLFITPLLPLPLYSGGQVRSWNLIKQIARKHEVVLYSFIRSPREQEFFGAIQKVVSSLKTTYRRPLMHPENFKNMLNMPFAAGLYFDKKVKQEISAIIKEGIDLVHCESFYTFPYLDPTFGVPMIAGNQNVEYMIYSRFIRMQSRVVQPFMAFDTERMKKYEQKKWQEASMALAVSENDRQIIEKVTGQECPVIPNGIDTDFFNEVKKEKPKVPTYLFVGPTKYIQNNDAALYLVKNIWPVLKRRVPNAKLIFVGRSQQKWLLELNNTDINVQTEVSDIRAAYSSASALLAPIRAGGGTKFKVLEAMASELPVITTRIGIEGIDYQENETVLLAETPEEFADKAAALLEDKSLDVKITLKAKALVREKYSWDKIGERLLYVYDQAAKK